MIRNLDFLRNPPEGLSIQQFGARLYEALYDLNNQHQTLAQQVNGNGNGQPTPPPAVQGIKVQAQNGHFQVSIQDESPIYRDIHYFVEHADNSHFTNPQIEYLGPRRNVNLFLGNVSRYFRAYSAYASSGPSAPTYHGGTIPAAVSGGGAVGGPSFLDSEGSGTGPRLTGLQGPGVTPFRSTTGAAPVR